MGWRWILAISILTLNLTVASAYQLREQPKNFTAFIEKFFLFLQCPNLDYKKINYTELEEYWDNASTLFHNVKHDVSAEVMVGLVGYLRVAFETLAQSEIHYRGDCVMDALRQADKTINPSFFEKLMESFEEVYEHLKLIFNFYANGLMESAGEQAGRYYRALFYPPPP